MRRGTSYRKVWAWKPWDQDKVVSALFFLSLNEQRNALLMYGIICDIFL